MRFTENKNIKNKKTKKSWNGKHFTAARNMKTTKQTTGWYLYRFPKKTMKSVFLSFISYFSHSHSVNTVNTKNYVIQSHTFKINKHFICFCFGWICVMFFLFFSCFHWILGFRMSKEFLAKKSKTLRKITIGFHSFGIKVFFMWKKTQKTFIYF